MLFPAAEDHPAEPDSWRLTDAIAVSEEYRIETLTLDETMASALSLPATQKVYI